MIIVRTPYRISLFGGGTDFPTWYNQHGGKVLAFSINKYSYLSARLLPPFFPHSYRVSYSKIEEVVSLNQMEHPAFRHALQLFGRSKSLEIHHHGDLPARSGIGSSSAFAVGIINILSSINGNFLETVELANLAINFEQNVLNENVGSQDQITCALGGVNSIVFKPNQNWESEKLEISESYQREISDRAVLFYSGVARNSSDISKLFLENIPKSTENMLNLVKLAEEGSKLFKIEGDLDELGELLNESMRLKSAINPNSVNSNITELIQHAKKCGASGAKILGAGGGGFFLFWLPPGVRSNFLSRMSPGVVVPFEIDQNGTQVIFNNSLE